MVDLIKKNIQWIYYLVATMVTSGAIIGAVLSFSKSWIIPAVFIALFVLIFIIFSIVIVVRKNIKSSSESDNEIAKDNDRACESCKTMECASCGGKECNLKDVLSFVGNEYTITIPAYRKELIKNSNNYFNMSLIKEIKPMRRLVIELSKKGFELLDYPPADDTNTKIYTNEIHIGSPISSIETANWLKDIKLFKCYAPIETIENSPLYTDTDIDENEINRIKKIIKEVVYSSTIKKWKFGYGEYGEEIKCDINKDYAILIKFEDENRHRTIHLLFGSSEAGTRHAVNLLINNHSHPKLSQHLKKKQYCLAIPINHKKDDKIGKANIEETEYLTGDVFTTKKTKDKIKV